MKVTLFGATGKTGPFLINEGLKRGFEITVFARTSSSFEDSRVRTVRGELTDLRLLRDAIRGSDAVLSALGPTSPRHPKTSPIARATEAIVAAMKQEGVTRLIAISTGTAADPGDGFEWKVRLPASLIRIGMPSAYQDIVALAKSLRASQLEWTMVRVGFLKNSPASEHLNVGLYGNSQHSLTVTRENVARFMFDQVANREFIHKAPGISSRG